MTRRPFRRAPAAPRPPLTGGPATTATPQAIATPPRSILQALPWWVQVAACGVLVGAGTAAWRWVAVPVIPRPDLAGADPQVVLAIDDAADRVRVNPGAAAAWGELGLVLYAQAYGDEAVACFKRATALDGRTWRWPFFTAAARSHLDPGEGADLMQEAIRRDPTAVWPRLLRAEWLVALGRGEEARAEFEALLAVSPDHARARLGLARLLLASGDVDAALVALGTAVDHPSTRRAAREFASQLATRRGDRAGAERSLTAARALPPDTPWPDDPLAAELPQRRVGKRSRIKLVSQMEKAGQISEADALTRRIEEDHPEIYLFVEGRIQLEKGDPAAAEKVLRQALTIDPRAVEVRFQLGRAIALGGRHPEAAGVFREVLAAEPGYGPAWLELGRSLGHTDRAAAITAFESAIAYMPTSAEARDELARLRGDAASSPPPTPGPPIR